MQSFKFDNRVSWMDIVAITAAGLALMNAYYGVGIQVDQNTAAIVQNQKTLERLEVKAEQGDERVLKEIDELKDNVKEVKVESQEGRLRIEKKIDRLIERELNP